MRRDFDQMRLMGIAALNPSYIEKIDSNGETLWTTLRYRIQAISSHRTMKKEKKPPIMN